MAEAARSSRRRAGAEQHAHRVAVLGLEFLHGRCLLDRIALRRDQAQTDLPVLARKCGDLHGCTLGRLATHEAGLREINAAVDLLLQGKSEPPLPHLEFWMHR